MEDFANDEHFGKTIAGRYRILEPLGRGGLGVVYKALDTRLRRFVALKVLTLTPTAEFDPSLLQGRAATSLNHPNIVQILDCGMVDNLMYVAAVYVEGSDLRQIMAKHESLDPQRAIEIIQEVGRGLEYLHQQGLVHRDVNPSNILISSQGSVMLTDFGLTIRSGTATLTETGIAGTPAYMSPEQAMGRPVSAASDVFSLGIILYELLMGCHPFLKSSPEETLRSVVEAVPAIPQQSILALGAPLTILIKKALQKDPNRRFGNCTEFLAALDIGKKGLAIKQLVESQRNSRPDQDFISSIFGMPRDSSDSKAPTVRVEAPLRVETAERLHPALPDLEQSSQAPKSARPFWPRKGPLLLGIALIAFVSLTVWNTSRWQFWAGLAGTAGIATWYLVWKFRDSRDDRKPLTLSLSVAAANPSALPKSKPVARTPSQGSAGHVPVTLLNIKPYKIQSDVKATKPLYRNTLASLFVFDSSGRSEAFRLGNQFTIGRVESCDLVVESRAASRTHAQIFFENGRFYIKDLSSSLGTFVNGSRIEICELHHEDEITIGDKSMLFVQDVSPRLNSDARRRRKEFETVWEQLTSSARDE